MKFNERRFATLDFKKKKIEGTYYIQGEDNDAAVILIHCAWHNANVMYDYANELSKSYKVVVVDMLNHYGKEQYPNATLEDHVLYMQKMVKALQKDGLITSPFTVHSWSMGTTIASLLASQYPEDYKRLVLIGCSHNWENNPFPHLKSEWQKCFLMSLGYLLKLKTTNIRYVAKALCRLNYNMAEVSICNSDNELIKSIDITQDLKNLSCKVTLIKPFYDKVMSEEVCKHYAKHIKNWEVVTIPDSGHLIVSENPKLLAQYTLNMIGDN